MPNSAAWTPYDRHLLRSLRIKADRELPVIRHPRLFVTGLALLMLDLAILALWIAYLVQTWN